MNAVSGLLLIGTVAACSSQGGGGPVDPGSPPSSPPPPPVTRVVDVLAFANGPRNVAVAGGQVYWSELSGAPIQRVPSGGGEATALARSIGFVGLGIAGTSLYRAEYRRGLGKTVIVRSNLDGSGAEDVVEADGGYTRAILRGDRVIAAACSLSPAHCTLRVLPLDGGPVADIVTLQTWSVQIDADDAYVYWLDTATTDAAGIRRMPLAGGASESVAEPVPMAFFGAFARSGANLVISEVDTRVVVPIADGTTRRVLRVPAGGGERVVLGERTGDGGVADLLVAGSEVIWRDGSGVFSTPLAGGATGAVPATPLPIDHAYSSIVAADGTIFCSVYDLIPENAGYVAPLAGSPLAESVSSPRVFAADGNHLYWTQASGQLERAPIAGGPVEHLAGGAGGASQPFIAVGGGRLWEAEGPYVKQLPLDGGVPEERLVSDGTILQFAADEDAAYAITMGGSLWRIPATGSPQRLSTAMFDAMGRMRAAGGFVYWVVFESVPSVGASAYAIYRMPATGGARERVVGGLAGVEDFVVTRGSVYFKEMGGPVARARAGGGAAQPLTSAMGGPLVLAADDTHLFVAGEFDVFKLPLEGGAVVPLLNNGTFVGPNALAVDGEAVYWTDGYHEAVLRLSPK